MAQTNYLYHRIVFVEWNRVFSMNQNASTWDPDVGGEYTFGTVRLSATGEEPATHSVCNTRATFQMKNQIDGFDNRPQVSVYDGNLWTWQQALDDMNLQVIEQEM